MTKKNKKHQKERRTGGRECHIDGKGFFFVFFTDLLKRPMSVNDGKCAFSLPVLCLDNDDLAVNVADIYCIVARTDNKSLPCFHLSMFEQ